MSTIESLQSALGLDEYEARIYVAAVSEGACTITALATASALPRTALYSPVQKLLRRGLISCTVVGRRKVYSALAPHHLPQILRRKADELADAVKELAPDRGIEDLRSGLGVQYFKGKEGIKSAGDVFLAGTQTPIWYSFEDITSLTDYVGAAFELEYIKRRVKKGIRSRMILSGPNASRWLRDLVHRDKAQLRETRIVNPALFPIESLIVTTPGLSLFVTTKRTPFALLVRNKEIARTLISVHDLAWRIGKEWVK